MCSIPLAGAKLLSAQLRRALRSDRSSGRQALPRMIRRCQLRVQHVQGREQGHHHRPHSPAGEIRGAFGTFPTQGSEPYPEGLKRSASASAGAFPRPRFLPRGCVRITASRATLTVGLAIVRSAFSATAISSPSSRLVVSAVNLADADTMAPAPCELADALQPQRATAGSRFSVLTKVCAKRRMACARPSPTETAADSLSYVATMPDAPPGMAAAR
jgi:hypothetical protein